MSQITRCPTCQTVFRVVQDQLRMSDGWVRCGQCSGVFDARATLAASATELSSIELAMQVHARPEELVQPPAFLAPAEEPQPEVFYWEQIKKPMNFILKMHFVSLPSVMMKLWVSE